MSKFLSKEAGRLDPYTPGEQPQDQQYIKLNTNESPFPPSPKVLEALSGAEITRLNLYSDPTCASLTAAIAGRCHVQPENVIAGNGSDEILAFHSVLSAAKASRWPTPTSPTASTSLRWRCSVWSPR